ncbi:hypothetical protein BAUCODRAFT_234482 [Baudoinia panamericana UAMH 10762]|uniref:Uncharacterized protein n=1 Tax=Baudoinia panamericana (strain UAMH 10762) TaxID=717646 RepID=M2N2Q0_BAUPA|nr:uncharacterized protein BAUCODRAFT_234482 [Baudoinia panamericana UAMH 10762]EMC93254.1 hypothetical protein BAUCODRAFT_234482 [Baudoinia panamericana UAMH 10762]
MRKGSSLSGYSRLVRLRSKPSVGGVVCSLRLSTYVTGIGRVAPKCDVLSRERRPNVRYIDVTGHSGGRYRTCDEVEVQWMFNTAAGRPVCRFRSLRARLMLLGVPGWRRDHHLHDTSSPCKHVC